MGRELRRVPANWEHPKKENGRYKPLFGHSFTQRLTDWEKDKEKWDEGLVSDYKGGWEAKEEKYAGMPFEEWSGSRPEEDDYMPEWDESELTHIQLYETTSKGTPKSPVFPANQLEQLCEYAAENCSTFANFKTSKEGWMKMLSDGLVFHAQGNMIFI